jgi:6-phosphofructokinase
MKHKVVRLGLCTGGGDCPGLNAAIRAVVRHATLHHGMEVVGVRDGLNGLQNQPNDVRVLTVKDMRGIEATGGTILGTNNSGSPFRDAKQGAAVLKQIKDSWQAQRLDAAIIIGGDGTHNMAKHLAVAGLNLVGVPKTIDNDLVGTERTIGFATAVDVAAAAVERLKSSADAHNRVMILEVMGRDAGHIALAAAIAGGADVALLPELPFAPAHVAAVVQSKQAEGRAAVVVVVAEGAYADGSEPSFQESSSGQKLLGGIGNAVARDITKRTGVDARVTVLGHLQRGGAPNAEDKILAAAFGCRAVDLVASKKFGRIVAWRDGKLTDFAYADVAEPRRLVALSGDDITTARGLGIVLQ